MPAAWSVVSRGSVAAFNGAGYGSAAVGDAVAQSSGERGADSRFFPRIESLRGVAALMVAVFHSIHLLPIDGVDKLYLRTVFDLEGPATVVARLLMGVFNGAAAVSLFFVISGLVLRLALDRETRGPDAVATSFVARRFFRIYPALGTNLLMMFAVGWALHLAWPAAYTSAPTPTALLRNLMLVDVPINGATWSLQVEFLAVPFFLAAHFATRRFGSRAIVVFVLFLILALFRSRLFFRFHLVSDFMFMFGLGMVVADFAPRLIARLTRRRAGGLFALGVALLLGARLVIGYTSRWSLLVEGIGGAIVVALVTYGPAIRPIAWLDPAPVRALGRISYSFYLYHPLFLMTFVGPLLGSPVLATGRAEWPLVLGLAIALVTIPPTWLVGALSHRLVERGAIGFGRRQEKRLLAAVARQG